MKATKYKRLPEKFTHKNHGYDYTLIERKGRSAWYEARWKNDDKLQGYLVARIMYQRESNLNGYKYPAQELLPRESHFGSMAWFFMPTSKHIAEKRFDELVAKHSQKDESGLSPTRK